MSTESSITKDHQQQAMIAEWKSLQHSYDRYEGLSLVIKISAFLAWIVTTALALDTTIILALLALIWFQEAIWKTFQSRTEDRLIVLENAWHTQKLSESLSFYTNWQDQRPGTTGLIAAYIKNAMRPTIMYPYIILIAITVVL